MNKILKDPGHSLGTLLHVTGAASLALVVSVYYFVCYERFLARSGKSDYRIELLTNELRDSDRIRTDHYRLQQTYESLESTVGKLRSRLSKPLDKEQLSQSLKQAVLDANMDGNKLTIGKNDQTPGHSCLELELECSGSYASICSFVENLGELAWITDITQLRIETTDQGTEYTLLAKFSVYYDRTFSDSDKS